MNCEYLSYAYFQSIVKAHVNLPLESRHSQDASLIYERNKSTKLRRSLLLRDSLRTHRLLFSYALCEVKSEEACIGDKVDEEFAADATHDEEFAAAAALATHDEEFATAATLATHNEEFAAATALAATALAAKNNVNVKID
jgi:hypothetical protein